MERNISTMENSTNYINNSIGCTVHECKFHAQDVDFCTLKQIMVTKHEKKADTKKCTDCGSFEAKESTKH